MRIKNSRRQGIIATLVVALLVATGCATTPEQETPAPAATAAESETMVVVDLSGREVTIPVESTKVANLLYISKEPTILLGATDQVIATASGSDYWTGMIAPDYDELHKLESGREPNVEELVELGVEVVFLWGDMDEVTEQLEDAGIAVVQATASTEDRKIESPEDFLAAEQREMMLYGQVYGGDALQKAEEWAAYAEETINEINERTKDLSDEERPRVFYVRGPDAVRTHGGVVASRWLVEIAGGTFFHPEEERVQYDAVMEDIVAFNPEHILMGRVGNVELVTEDPAWQTLQAVKDGNVHLNLKGIGSTESSSTSILLMQQIAKMLHPELFADIDMIEETQEYYSTFYGYDLTDAEAEEILTFAHTD